MGMITWLYALLTVEVAIPMSRVTLFTLTGFMVFNATFNNISIISWRSVLLVVKTGVPGENNRSAASHVQT
jgi:hypothetical protein